MQNNYIAMTNDNLLIECGITELIVSIAIIMLSFVVCMIASVFIPNNNVNEALVTVIIYLPGIIYLFKKDHIFFTDELHKPLLVKYTIIGLVVIVVMFIKNYYWSEPNQGQNSFLTCLHSYTVFGKVIYLVLGCIIISISEEVLFRYYYYNILKNSCGKFLGIIISILLFVGVHIFHPNPLSVVLLGLLCTYVYEKSRSILSSIIVHSFNNSMWFLVTYMVSVNTN